MERIWVAVKRSRKKNSIELCSTEFEMSDRLRGESDGE